MSRETGPGLLIPPFGCTWQRAGVSPPCCAGARPAYSAPRPKIATAPSSANDSCLPHHAVLLGHDVAANTDVLAKIVADV